MNLSTPVSRQSRAEPTCFPQSFKLSDCTAPHQSRPPTNAASWVSVPKWKVYMVMELLANSPVLSHSTRRETLKRICEAADECSDGMPDLVTESEAVQLEKDVHSEWAVILTGDLYVENDEWDERWNLGEESPTSVDSEEIEYELDPDDLVRRLERLLSEPGKLAEGLGSGGAETKA